MTELIFSQKACVKFSFFALLGIATAQEQHSLYVTSDISKPQFIVLKTHVIGKDVSGACEFLKGQRQALISFKAWLGEAANVPLGNCKNGGLDFGESVALEVPKEYLPEFFRKNLNEKIKVLGPNCFNSALFLNQILNQARLSTEKEFDYWLRSPLCKKISSVDKIKNYPVIGVIAERVGKNEIPWIHAFVQVSDQMVYEKLGAGTDTTYSLNQKDWMRNTYPVSARCENGDHPDDCVRWKEYYECQKLSDYMNSKNRTADLQFFVANVQLRRIENQISTWALHDGPPAELSKIKTVEDELKKLEKLGLEAFEVEKEAIYKMLWKGYFLAIESNQLQLANFRDALKLQSSELEVPFFDHTEIPALSTLKSSSYFLDSFQFHFECKFGEKGTGTLTEALSLDKAGLIKNDSILFMSKNSWPVGLEDKMLEITPVLSVATEIQLKDSTVKTLTYQTLKVKRLSQGKTSYGSLKMKTSLEVLDASKGGPVNYFQLFEKKAEENLYKDTLGNKAVIKSTSAGIELFIKIQNLTSNCNALWDIRYRAP